MAQGSEGKHRQEEAEGEQLGTSAGCDVMAEKELTTQQISKSAFLSFCCLLGSCFCEVGYSLPLLLPARSEGSAPAMSYQPSATYRSQTSPTALGLVR